MKLAVRRFDPVHDAQPYWAVYEVGLGLRQTVLDGLLQVAAEQDPTLAFRRMCRSGICGACAAVVNGRPRLMCQTLVGDVSTGVVAQGQVPAGLPEADVVLEPLPRFRVLKDLVVDLEPFLASLQRLQAWVTPRADYDGRVTPELAERLWGVAPCVLCGICAAVPGAPGVGAEVAGAPPHPAVVARALRMALDPRDEAGTARLQVFQELGLLAPQVARWLREVCPKGVEVEPLVERLAGSGVPSGGGRPGDGRG